jgi:hypothetical protein
MAYAEDARGESGRAIALLERAEREATAREQRVERAIAKYQRAKRIGGSEGARLAAAARDDLGKAGAKESVLEEDAGGR